MFYSLRESEVRHRDSENTEMKSKTFNNGSLGSGNDEERSETRKVMRIAESVSHRIFERTLRLSVFREARLFERHYKLQAQA